MKPGERFKDSLAREVFEETGLKVEVGKPVAVKEWRVVVRGEEWQIVGVFFECFASSSEVKLSPDHDAFEWINPEKYNDYDIVDEKVLEEYLQGL